MTTHFTLFDTAIGLCGLVWRGETIVGVLLPEGGAEKSRAGLRRRFTRPQPITADIRDRRLIARVQALLDVELVDLAAAVLDIRVDRFRARSMHRPRHPARPGHDLWRDRRTPRRQACSPAMSARRWAEPYSIIIPCHRVLAAGRKTGRVLRPRRLGHQAADCWRSRDTRRGASRRCSEPFPNRSPDGGAVAKRLGGLAATPAADDQRRTNGWPLPIQRGTIPRRRIGGQAPSVSPAG